MIKRSGLINLIITFIATIGSALLVILLGNPYSASLKTIEIIVLYLAGAFFWGFITTLLHEIGHVITAKRNGFEILSVSIIFLKWTKQNGKYVFSFTLPLEEMGSVELVSKSTENLAKRYKKATSGSLIFTIPLIIVGVVSLCLINILPFYAYAVLAILLPIVLYSVAGNALPVINNGACNDGAVIWSINKNTNSMQVHLNLLAIQSELFNGKTPCEIDENFYFDLPQLPEDDINFIMLLNARYNLYLDKKDYKNAKKCIDRLLTLLDYMPKTYQEVIKADALYNACTFDKNEQVADDLMYELDKFLNKKNTATSVRIKLAYILVLEQDLEKVELFYKKGKKEAEKCQIKGLGKFESKLLDQLANK